MTKFKIKLLFFVSILGVISSCEVVDQDLELNNNAETSDTSEATYAKATGCTKSGSISDNFPDPKNHGVIDDRTCSYNYEERQIGSITFGSYRVSAGSNHVDTPDENTNSTLSPRMERRFVPRPHKRIGAYQHFKGTFRIEDVGGGRGTYIAQVKGQHEGGEYKDPAIALFIARKRIRDKKRSDGSFVIVNGIRVKETVFDIYREQITKRDGRFSNNGRKDVKITTVLKSKNFIIDLKTGFNLDINGNFQHYVTSIINGKKSFFRVPESDKALETGIRYGAYVVESGTARVFVGNTYFKQVD